MSAEYLMYPPVITNHGVFKGGPCDAQVNYLQDLGGGCEPQPWTNQWIFTTNKTPREQVQEEILLKVAEAVKEEDLKKAGKLLELAKALKEL